MNRTTAVLLISMSLACLLIACGYKAPQALPQQQQQQQQQQALPQFPWPPPRASARYEVPSNYIRNPNGRTVLREISQRLEAAIDRAGYAERSWYSAPGGFALATQLEQFKDDGTPTEGAERWSERMLPRRISSFSDYFSALFTSRPGHYRVIAFVVTNQPLTYAQRGPTREEARDLVYSGGSRLPSSISEQEFTNDHGCTALIYEFEQATENTAAVLQRPGRLTADMHLEKSKILGALRR